VTVDRRRFFIWIDAARCADLSVRRNRQQLFDKWSAVEQKDGDFELVDRDYESLVLWLGSSRNQLDGNDPGKLAFTRVLLELRKEAQKVDQRAPIAPVVAHV
jgi:predicted methyltransferase MtxX (methanogen marker protein 4)